MTWFFTATTRASPCLTRLGASIVFLLTMGLPQLLAEDHGESVPRYRLVLGQHLVFKSKIHSLQDKFEKEQVDDYPEDKILNELHLAITHFRSGDTHVSGEFFLNRMRPGSKSIVSQFGPSIRSESKCSRQKPSN